MFRWQFFTLAAAFLALPACSKDAPGPSSFDPAGFIELFGGSVEEEEAVVEARTYTVRQALDKRAANPGHGPKSREWQRNESLFDNIRKAVSTGEYTDFTSLKGQKAFDTWRATYQTEELRFDPISQSRREVVFDVALGSESVGTITARRTGNSWWVTHIQGHQQ